MLYHFGCAVKSSGVDKMFITGVMPVDWTGVTSSLNTVKDLTHIPSFENTFGFKSSDMAELLVQFFPEMATEDRDKHLESMKSKCLGYRRSPTQVETLYNPQGVWYYLKELQKRGIQTMPHMDPNVIPSSGDEVAAFLVKHAAAMDTTYSPVHFFTEVIPFSPRCRFAAQSLFRSSFNAPEALLSMAHHCGYLSYAYPKHEVNGDCLVAPNDEMREVFMDALLNSLPGEYSKLARKFMAKTGKRADVLKIVYDAYKVRDLTGAAERLEELVRNK